MGDDDVVGTQFLTFKLADGIYALDIAKVREVLDFTTVTKVPAMPTFLCGVTNLRGSVVPVVDLRTRFGLDRTERTVNTCIIIAEATVDGDRLVLGALADAVQEVVDLGPEHIAPPPKLGSTAGAAFLRGMGMRGDRFIMILDIDRLFAGGAMTDLLPGRGND